MALTRTLSVSLAALLFTVGPAAADEHVRGTTPSARQLIERGLAQSPTLRALVDRLNESDVIVYVEEKHLQTNTLAGQLTFVSQAGGFRYLQVKLRWRGLDVQQIATLAHELQHAVEIAERPDVIDNASLALAYRHLGHERSMKHGPAGMFETEAAVQAGNRVWREVAGKRKRSGD